MDFTSRMWISAHKKWEFMHKMQGPTRTLVANLHQPIERRIKSRDDISRRLNQGKSLHQMNRELLHGKYWLATRVSVTVHLSSGISNSKVLVWGWFIALGLLCVIQTRPPIWLVRYIHKKVKSSTNIGTYHTCGTLPIALNNDSDR